jgi:hypothetical protein
MVVQSGPGFCKKRLCWLHVNGTRGLGSFYLKNKQVEHILTIISSPKFWLTINCSYCEQPSWSCSFSPAGTPPSPLGHCRGRGGKIRCLPTPSPPPSPSPGGASKRTLGIAGGGGDAPSPCVRRAGTRKALCGRAPRGMETSCGGTRGTTAAWRTTSLHCSGRGWIPWWWP